MVLLLDIFEQATQMISGDQYPTSSLIIPIIYGLFDNIQSFGPRISTAVGEIFLETLKNCMNDRLLEYESRTVCRISTILHPVFRNSFRQLQNKLAAKDCIKAEINIIFRIRNIRRIRNISQNAEEIATSSENSTRETGRPDLLGFLKRNTSNVDMTLK